jgi:hypothetical protein
MNARWMYLLYICHCTCFSYTKQMIISTVGIENYQGNSIFFIIGFTFTPTVFSVTSYLDTGKTSTLFILFIYLFFTNTISLSESCCVNKRLEGTTGTQRFSYFKFWVCLLLVRSQYFRRISYLNCTGNKYTEVQF